MNKETKELLAAYQDKLELIRSGARANINETKAEQKARIERFKLDPDACTKYYFGEYMRDDDGNMIDSAEFQIQLAYDVKGDPTCKILVRWGRGLAKSVWCDLFIVFWLWMNKETFFAVLVGNNLDKAKLLLSDLQAEFEANPRIIHDFGEQLGKGNWTKGFFRTKNGFVAKALGMGQSPRGLRMRSRRPDLISADDLEDRETAKSLPRQKEIVRWITKDLIPIMDGPRRRYLHPNNNPFPTSIQGLLEDKFITGKKKPKWKLSQVNAYDPITYEPAWKAKYSNTYYQELEEEIGSTEANAEYNNDGYIEGEIFKEDMIQWEKRPRLDHFDLLMGVWDPAYSGNSDFNAVPVWGLKGRELWKIKQFCKQSKMAAPIMFMHDYEKALPEGATIIWKVEKQFWNDSVIQALEQAELDGYPLNISVIDRARVDKFIRIMTMHPLYQAKRIKYADCERNDEDMKKGLNQLYGIDYGYSGHDDSPDADEYTLHEILKFTRVERTDNIRIASRAKVIGKSKNRF